MKVTYPTRPAFTDGYRSMENIPGAQPQVEIDLNDPEELRHITVNGRDLRTVMTELKQMSEAHGAAIRERDLARAASRKSEKRVTEARNDLEAARRERNEANALIGELRNNYGMRGEMLRLAHEELGTVKRDLQAAQSEVANLTERFGSALHAVGWLTPAEACELRHERDQALSACANERSNRKYHEHSVTLNRITWRMLEALGDVPKDAPMDASHVCDSDNVSLRLLALLEAKRLEVIGKDQSLETLNKHYEGMRADAHRLRIGRNDAQRNVERLERLYDDAQRAETKLSKRVEELKAQNNSQFSTISMLRKELEVRANGISDLQRQLLAVDTMHRQTIDLRDQRDALSVSLQNCQIELEQERKRKPAVLKVDTVQMTINPRIKMPLFQYDVMRPAWDRWCAELKARNPNVTFYWDGT